METHVCGAMTLWPYSDVIRPKRKLCRTRCSNRFFIQITLIIKKSPENPSGSPENREVSEVSNGYGKAHAHLTVHVPTHHGDQACLTHNSLQNKYLPDRLICLYRRTAPLSTVFLSAQMFYHLMLHKYLHEK